MTKKARLDRSARKRQIVAAVLPLFSEKGLYAVTSKNMAEAAGVSEALIYKYFPHKKDIIQSVYESVCIDLTKQLDSLNDIPNNFNSLNLFIKKFLEHIFASDVLVSNYLPRIIMRSIIEDGEFAAYFL